jgi:hypothetical protein
LKVLRKREAAGTAGKVRLLVKNADENAGTKKMKKDFAG